MGWDTRVISPYSRRNTIKCSKLQPYWKVFSCNDLACSHSKKIDSQWSAETRRFIPRMIPKVEPCRPCRKMWLKTQRYKTSKYSQNRDEYTPLMGSYGIFTFFGHLWQKWFDPSPSFFLIHPGTSSSSSLAMWSWPPWHALCRAVQPSTEKCAKTSAPCKSSSRAIFTLALASGSSTKAGWVERNPHTEISKAMGKIWKIAHLQMMYLLDMMIFSSYVK